MNVQPLNSIGMSHLRTLRAIQTVAEKELKVSTPVFDETIKKMSPRPEGYPKFMVIWIAQVGPTVACAVCGVLSSVHSTDLGMLNDWSLEHATRAHSGNVLPTVQ